MEEEESVADDIEWDNLENEDVLTGIETLPIRWREGNVRGASGGRPYRWPTPAANRGGWLYRRDRGASGGRWLYHHTPRAKGSEPLYLGAGGGLETALPRLGGAGVRGFTPKHIRCPTSLM